MGIVVPIGSGGQMMYVPDGNEGHSITYHDIETLIVLSFVFFIFSFISVFIEWQIVKMKVNLKDYLFEVFTSGLSMHYSKYDISIVSALLILFFYISIGLSIITASVYGIIKFI